MKIQQIFLVPPQKVAKIFRTSPPHNYSNLLTAHSGTVLKEIDNYMCIFYSAMCVALRYAIILGKQRLINSKQPCAAIEIQ